MFNTLCDRNEPYHGFAGAPYDHLFSGKCALDERRQLSFGFTDGVDLHSASLADQTRGFSELALLVLAEAYGACPLPRLTRPPNALSCALPDAISRAYYAMFHAASALLASLGREARSHDGVRSLVAEHFIRPGLLSVAQGRALSRMAGDRSDEDDNVASVFERTDVEQDIEIAASFLDEASLLLTR